MTTETIYALSGSAVVVSALGWWGLTLRTQVKSLRAKTEETDRLRQQLARLSESYDALQQDKETISRQREDHKLQSQSYSRDRP